MDADLLLSYLDILPADLASTFADDLAPASITVTVEPRPTEPQAAIEWLIPTAVVLFITQKYLGTMIQEVAKEHYPVLKAAITRLVRRTTGSTREIHLRAVGTQNKVQSAEPVIFSVYVELRSGTKAKFCFEHSLPDADVVRAIGEFLDSVLAYQRADPAAWLIEVEAGTPPSRWRPIVLVFIPSTGSWAVRIAATPPEPE